MIYEMTRVFSDYLGNNPITIKIYSKVIKAFEDEAVPVHGTSNP